MNLKLVYQSPDYGKINSHFLLKKAKVNARLYMADGSTAELDFTPESNNEIHVNLGSFEVAFKRKSIESQTVRGLKLYFKIEAEWNGKKFVFLQITQYFTIKTVGKKEFPDTVVFDYQIEPFKWINCNGESTILNFSTHPLLNLSDLDKEIIKVNALIVDLTELWLELHKDNRIYKAFLFFHDKEKVEFKVFGHLAGSPFIWYSIVPRYLKDVQEVSPHIFFQPSDNAVHQNNANDESYLFKNNEHFQSDGVALVKYLLPPIDDVKVQDLLSSGLWSEEFIKLKRNVVSVRFVGTGNKDKISPKQWSIGAGFEKAFYGNENSKPLQYLIIPQHVGSGAKSIKSVVVTHKNALKTVTDSISLFLYTNTRLLNSSQSSNNKIASNVKLIISCYSESGFDFWFSCKSNIEYLKAGIAIEPQNINSQQNAYGTNPPIGKEVIPQIIKNGAKLFLIGRHHLSYKPVVSADVEEKIVFMPDKKIVKEMFKYPPNPNAHPFIKYRTFRFIDPAQDPFLFQEEQEINERFAKSAPPVKGMDLIKKIFVPLHNEDSSDHTESIFDTWYSHQYALSGGQIMNLPASGSIYNQPLTYKTFFQEAVEQIG